MDDLSAREPDAAVNVDEREPADPQRTNTHSDQHDREIAALRERLARAEHEAAELRGSLQRLDGEYQALKQRVNTPQPASNLPLPLDAEAAYPLWIASRATAAYAHELWRAERIAEWPYQPKISPRHDPSRRDGGACRADAAVAVAAADRRLGVARRRRRRDAGALRRRTAHQLASRGCRRRPRRSTRD